MIISWRLYKQNLSSNPHYATSAYCNPSDPESYVPKFGHTNHNLALLAQNLQMGTQDWQQEVGKNNNISSYLWKKGKPGSFLNSSENICWVEEVIPWAVHVCEPPSIFVFTNVWHWSTCSLKNVELWGILYAKAVKYMRDEKKN